MSEVMDKTTVLVYGTHQFEVMADADGLDDEVAWIRLSRFGWTPCEAQEAQGMRSYMEMTIKEEAPDENVPLPSGFGVLASKGGEIIGYVREDGTVSRVKYLGAESEGQGQKGCRMSLFSLAKDEEFEGRTFAREPWDYWAMGRPV